MSYYLAIFNAAGEQVARLADFIQLQSQRQVNGIGTIRFSLFAEHQAAPYLNHLTLVKLYRKETAPAVPWYLENYGLIVSREWSLHPVDGKLLTCIAVHPNWFLSTRIVAWKAGAANRSVFTNQKAETIAKALVTYNITAAALASAGRERDGYYTAAPVTVQPDAAQGPSLDWYCAYQNLLETLQALSCVGAGDFGLIPKGSGYEFRWYDGQLGTDRTASVLFAVERGNLANPVYGLDRQEEKTVAIVGGRGEGPLRMVASQQGDDYATDNDIETFLYAVHIATYAGLQTHGDRYLYRQRANPLLTFDIVQTQKTCYGLHYDLGDLVTVRNPFTGLDIPSKVSEVTITLQAMKPVEIKIKVESLNTLPRSLLVEQFNTIQTTDNLSNDTLDGYAFTDTDYLYGVDADLFSTSYIIAGVNGGSFAPVP